MTAVELHSGIDKDAVLKELHLNPRDPKAQTYVLVCQRYGLDPLMKHVVIIDGNLYITRDGYLTIAHQTQALDGIEVTDEGEDETHWWARVAVYRKDMGRPFTYRGRYPKDGTNKKYGPEMAVKTAEVMALRRAFDVTGVGALEERWDEPEPVPVVPVDPDQWFRDNGWKDQAHHDSFMTDAKLAMKEVAATATDYRDEMVMQWELRDLHWPLTYQQMDQWSQFLVPLARKAKASAKTETQAGAGETGDRAAKEPVSQPSQVELVADDA